MNPYRSTPLAQSITAPRRHPRVRRKTFGYALIAIGATGPAFDFSTWALVACGVTILLGIALAAIGRSRTPYTRLCSLVWHRGDRFGATLLFFNVIEPRSSAKRLARNRAAVAAVSARCPEYRNPLNDLIMGTARRDR